jgi:cell division septum initiation protein DivIVA
VAVSTAAFDLNSIRSASFPTAKHGYDRRAVDHFLVGLVDWLETAPRVLDGTSEELDWVEARDSKTLLSAEEVARSIVDEANERARRILERAEREADRRGLASVEETDRLRVQLGEARRESARLEAELERGRQDLDRVAELERMAIAAQERSREVEQAAGAEIARLRLELANAVRGQGPTWQQPQPQPEPQPEHEPELRRLEHELRVLEQELRLEARDLRQREQELLRRELERATSLRRRLEGDLAGTSDRESVTASVLSADFAEQLALTEARFDRAERHIDHLARMGRTSA